MPLTIGLAGMDPATEAALKAAFNDANDRLSGRWHLLPETQAEHIVVDMDSMYGPMSWLRLHAAGKQVVGLTSAPRTQTDFRLGRPFSIESLVELLRQIEGHGVVETEAAAEAPVTAATPETATPVAAPEAVAATVVPARPTPAIASTATAPESPAPIAAFLSPNPAAEPQPQPAATNVTSAEPGPVATPPASPVTLFDWLAGQRLRGRVRYARPSGPALLIDADARSYHGPSTLKPLAQYFEGEVAAADFDTLDAATWAHESAAAGAAQPLPRLVWFGALVSGKGSLLPGHDPGAKYQLNRWPQTEREFPRHFRIATAMMKGPATLAEIAEGSGIAPGEVADFVNASLATGVAEPYREPPAEPATPARSGGLLGRLRGR